MRTNHLARTLWFLRKKRISPRLATSAVATLILKCQVLDFSDRARYTPTHVSPFPVAVALLLGYVSLTSCARSPEAYLSDGNQLYQRGRYKEARTKYLRALAK